MTALLNPRMPVTTALEKRARLDFVIIHPDKAGVGETLVPVSGSASKNAQKQKSILDPALFDMAMHPASHRAWGINE
jgi:hypothetical protein